jgi:hypothetical protein
VVPSNNFSAWFPQRICDAQLLFLISTTFSQRIFSADRKNIAMRMLTHPGGAVRWDAWKFERLPRSGFLRIA